MFTKEKEKCKQKIKINKKRFTKLKIKCKQEKNKIIFILTK